MKHTIVALFLGGLLVLAGCSGVMTAPENRGGPQDGSAGNLTVRIGYSLSPARTVYPSHDGTTPLEYSLEFSSHATATHEPVNVSPGVPASIRLETGSWTVTAQALAGGAVKASGSDTVIITDGGSADLAITLSAVGDPAPTTGTLGYALYFPAGTTGSLSLVDESGASPAGSPVTTLAGGTEDTLSLAPGSYLATVSLTNGAATAGRTEAMHIVAGLTTKVSYNFYEDLASAPISVTSDTDLEKIGVDVAWPLSGRYVLAQDITLANWMPLGSAADPFTGSFDGGGNTITITGFDTVALTGAQAKQYIGIFAAVKGSEHNKARVKNLTIASSVSIAALSTNAGQGIGLVSGYAEDAVISGINLSGNLTIAGVAKIIFAGGAVGDMRKGAELRDCVSGMDLAVTNTTTGANLPLYTGATTAVGGLAGFFLTSADGSEYGGGRDVLVKNCVNSGNVTVSHRSASIPVGGIAGGWAAGAAFYLGRIEDCVYTGDLSATISAGKSGGIVGAIAGNGGDAANDANTSRILQCRTAGTVSNTSMAARNGGMVGEVSNGALVAFSSSDVTVTKGTGPTVFSGGIAGYLLTGARISDCWSQVIVTGGIATGGIAGLPGSNFGTLGRCYTIVDQTELWVYPASEITGSPAAGAGTPLEDEKLAQWFYEITYGWDFDEVWTMGGDGYPRLRGVDEGY